MLKNIFKVFMLQVYKNKALAAINVLGIAMGLVCTILIALFVRHELSYDSFFSEAEDTFHIGLAITLPDGTLLNFSTTSPLATPLLSESFPSLRMATRLLQRQVLLKGKAESYPEDAFNLVDRNFFSVFDFDWLQGSAATAFPTPNAVVLTRTTAVKYFGAADPLGEILLMEKEGMPLVVTGVLEDLPSNTHLTGTAFASLDLLELTEDDPGAVLNNPRSQNFRSYAVLEPGTRHNVLNEHLRAAVDPEVNLGPGLTVNHVATPLRDMHMQAATLDDLRPGGNVLIVYAGMVIGLGILAMACINFINISTARASTRGREVGIRKALGATRADLALQFLGETFLLVGLAMVLALAAVEFLLPALDSLLGVNLRIGLSRSIAVLSILLTCLTLAVLAGCYPALYLSAFSPARVLKGLLSAGHAGARLRTVLVVLQFTIVIVLLIAASVIQAQLRHVRNLDLGFDSEQRLILDLGRSGARDQWPALRNALLQGPGILSATNSHSTPLRQEGIISLNGFRAEGEAAERSLPQMRVDSHYFATYDTALLEGRTFSTDFPGDVRRGESGTLQGSLVLNEQAAREFDWAAPEAIGKRLEVDGGYLTVVGVVANTVENARLTATPIVYFLGDGSADIVTLRLEEGRVAEALAHVDASWEALNVAEPLKRVFLDEKINSLYLQDSRQFQLCLLFSLIGIGIACLGLYGLAAFNTECRSKEVGVRRAVGGSVWSIVVLLTKDISTPVLLANLLAWPLAWFCMQSWLANFAYRIDLSPFMFVGSSIVALAIAWVTVGGTAAKAASAKPVHSLRYE